jgi:hypothetical protein
MDNHRIYIKYLLTGLFLTITGIMYSQTKIFTTDSINPEEWNYNQRKIIRTPEIGIIAESKNEIFFSYDLGDPVKIFDGKNASLAVDSNSNIHIIFEDNGIRYASKPDGGDWLTSILISDSSETGHIPVADCDADGNVHIVYGISDTAENGSIFLSSLKYVKISDNRKQISTLIYDIKEAHNPDTLISYNIANHLLYRDGTVFIAYQLSDDSIRLKYSVDDGVKWINGGTFRGTDPKLSIGYGQHWSDPVIEESVFPVLLYLDPKGNLVNRFAEFNISTYDTSIYWYGGDIIQNGPIKYFSIDDVIGPAGFSYIFQKDDTLYHAFSNLSNGKILDTITNNALESSIAYKHFNRFKVDIVWYEKNDNIYEMYYQWFEKIPQKPPLLLISSQSHFVCHGVNDGFIQTNATGGNPPYKYEWSTGDITSGISNLSAGIYAVTVTDSAIYGFSNYYYTFFQIRESTVETGDIKGPNRVYNSDTVIYSVSEMTGSVYNWTVTSGILLSGQGSDSVDVRWGDPGSGTISVNETNKDGCKGETVSINISIDVGINLFEINTLEIYPNPFSNHATIRLPNTRSGPYQLSVRNLSGQIVKIIDSITTDKVDLNCDGLPAGLYLLELKGSVIYWGKIVIE